MTPRGRLCWVPRRASRSWPKRTRTRDRSTSRARTRCTSRPCRRHETPRCQAQAADFDDTAWTVLSPPDTQRRLSTGRVCFNWYRITVTLPERVGDLDVAGSTVVFETVVDDYAEVWVNGSQPLALGDTGGQVVAGFNTPNRVVLTQAARPGQRFTIAVFGINGPISAAPATTSGCGPPPWTSTRRRAPARANRCPSRSCRRIPAATRLELDRAARARAGTSRGRI